MKSLAESLLEKHGNKSLNESAINPSTDLGGNIERNLTQFTSTGNIKRSVGKTAPTLESGVYKVGSDMRGVFFEKVNIKSDGLIRFKDERYESLLEEAKKFWGMKEDFKKVGMHYQRGIILEGIPGGGKSCLLKLMMEDVIAQGDLIFIGTYPSSIVEALKEFKEVETERNVMVVMEEVDEIIRYNQREMSELLDGQDKVSGVLFVATTNHINNIHPKFLREGRFDLKIKVGAPPKEGRAAYLKEKIGLVEADNIIEEIADATDGFTFAQLREYVISVYCYKKNPQQVIERIRKGGGLDESINLDKTDEEIRESVFYYYYAQDSVRSTKQFASNRNMARKEAIAQAKDLASQLMLKFGADNVALIIPQENKE